MDAFRVRSHPKFKSVAAGIPLLYQLLPDAAEQLNLSEGQLVIFLDSKPSGFELIAEFQERHPAEKTVDGFVKYIREVLSHTQHPVT